MTEDPVDRLARSPEPSVRYQVLVDVVGRDPAAPDMLSLREEIRHSPRVRRLLAHGADDGGLPAHPYAKWCGAHWALASLADLRYPPGDPLLIPLREQVLAWLLGESHEKSIRVIDGRVRRCASQEGNALYALLALGLADERVDELARRLRRWQWPDGGWNCDRRPAALRSSFMESLIPLRGLALHARLRDDGDSRAAALRASEVFLKRRLFRRVSDGSVMDCEFLRLHYPCYWHYDFLFGLVVLAEAGLVGDPRCAEALRLLEFRRLPDGSWPAEARYYTNSEKTKAGRSPVSWGGASPSRTNEFVTVLALSVLRKAGRETASWAAFEKA